MRKILNHYQKLPEKLINVKFAQFINTLFRVNAFGVFARGIEECMLFSRDTENTAYIIAGFITWAILSVTHHRLDKKYQQLNVKDMLRDSLLTDDDGNVDDKYERVPNRKTSLLMSTASHTAGFCLVNSIANFSKGMDTRAMNLGYLSLGLFLLPAVSQELNHSVILPNRPQAHEMLRFALLFLADIAKSIAMKQFLNIGFNPWYLIPLGCGLAVTISEFIYGLKKDPHSFQSTLMRRNIKLTAALNLVFPFYNYFFDKEQSNLDIFDHSFQIYIGLLLLTTTFQFKKLAAEEAQRPPKYRTISYIDKTTGQLHSIYCYVNEESEEEQTNSSSCC